MINSDFELTQVEPSLIQLINTKTMTDYTQITSNEDSIQVGFTAPDGMKWDDYGNPEFIEE